MRIRNYQKACESSEKDQTQLHRDVEAKVLKLDSKYSDLCFEVFTEKLDFNGYLEGDVCSPKRFYLGSDNYEAKNFFRKHRKLNQTIKEVDLVKILILPNQSFGKSLIKLLISPKSVIKAEDFHIYNFTKMVSQKYSLVKSTCSSLWNYTRSASLEYFRLKPTHIQRIIISGRHLENILFGKCWILEQECEPTFKNYSLVVNMETVEFYCCSPVTIYKDERCVLICTIMNEILNSTYRKTFCVTMSWGDRVIMSKEEIIQDLDCEYARDKIEINEGEVKFHLNT
ncbi:unnamed protein product [Moneuplotes crassus]|uniref:Uncharacterized protein n=1 Tax=Euplotes crassus TaxID=5936 RepID=A0AAD1XRS5_EUPCR|nr:unnamed protein product [Moneuplotes crassus]